jgi:hypothetical protein
MEKLELAGSSAKAKRELQSTKDVNSALETKLIAQSREATKLIEELFIARTRLQDSSTSYQSAGQPRVDQSIEAELQATRKMLELANEDIVKLSNMHKDMDCEAFHAFSRRQIDAAMNEAEAADAEIEAFKHLGEANQLIQEQNVAIQAQLAESMQETRTAEAKVAELERMTALQGKMIQKSEVKIVRLERELRAGKPDNCNANLGKLDSPEANKPSPDDPTRATVTPSHVLSGLQGAEARQEASKKPTLSLSITQAISTEPHMPVASDEPSEMIPSSDVPPSPALSLIQPCSTTPQCPPQDNRLDAAITINIEPTDRKNWSLLKRLQCAITSTCPLDIFGPHDLVLELVASMQACEDDHAAQTAAAAHWQKVALAALNEVDASNARPDCMVPSHRGLKEELEAKDLQLQLQAGVVAQWQRKMARCRAFVEESNREMRERGMQI